MSGETTWDPADRDHDLAIVRRHVAQLYEHFDAVQVLVTRAEGDGTVTCSYGAGNWYARYGAGKAWLVKEDAALRNSLADEEDPE